MTLGITPRRMDWLVRCSGKAQFDTMLQALRAANRRGRGKQRKKRSPYRCSGCGKYHLGG